MTGGSTGCPPWRSLVERLLACNRTVAARPQMQTQVFMPKRHLLTACEFRLAELGVPAALRDTLVGLWEECDGFEFSVESCPPMACEIWGPELTLAMLAHPEWWWVNADLAKGEVMIGSKTTRHTTCVSVAAEALVLSSTATHVETSRLDRVNAWKTVVPVGELHQFCDEVICSALS